MKRPQGSAGAEAAALPVVAASPVAAASGVADLLVADSEVEWSGAEVSGVQDLLAVDTVVALPVAGLGTSAWLEARAGVLQGDPAGELQARSQVVLGGASQAVRVGAVPVGAAVGPVTVRAGAAMVGADGAGRSRQASSQPALGAIPMATRGTMAAWSGTAIST